MRDEDSKVNPGVLLEGSVFTAEPATPASVGPNVPTLYRPCEAAHLPASMSGESPNGYRTSVTPCLSNCCHCNRSMPWGVCQRSVCIGLQDTPWLPGHISVWKNHLSGEERLALYIQRPATEKGNLRLPIA